MILVVLSKLTLPTGLVVEAVGKGISIRNCAAAELFEILEKLTKDGIYKDKLKEEHKPRFLILCCTPLMTTEKHCLFQVVNKRHVGKHHSDGQQPPSRRGFF